MVDGLWLNSEICWYTRYTWYTCTETLLKQRFRCVPLTWRLPMCTGTRGSLGQRSFLLKKGSSTSVQSTSLRDDSNQHAQGMLMIVVCTHFPINVQIKALNQGDGPEPNIYLFNSCITIGIKNIVVATMVRMARIL